MFSCGSKPVTNGKQILEEIRSLGKMNLAIKLNDYNLTFDEQNGDWKSKILKLSNYLIFER